jgi:hypothetical protein
MKRLSPWRWTAFLLVVLPLLSLACGFLTGGSAGITPTPAGGDLAAELTFGPGPYTHTDTAAGLAELSSYKATLIYSFDGTRSGSAEQWSKTYTMLFTAEPAARQLTVETIGADPPVETVFMAEANGAAYHRIGANACTASVLEVGDSFADWLEPAGMLISVIGADQAGSETVNGVPADHFTFDERALGGEETIQAAGELWVDSTGGHILRYLLTINGDTDYFGEGVEGTVSWDYQLTNIDQPITFDFPVDCPPGLVDAPQLPDAANVLNVPGVLTYDTASSPAAAAAFYQEQLPDLGWTGAGEPAVSEAAAFLSFTQGDRLMRIIITSGGAGRSVHILLGGADE